MDLGPCKHHGFEKAENACKTCGNIFCSECLVYAAGPKKPPYCTQCAVAAAGIRKSSKRNRIGSKRAIRKQNRAVQKLQREERRQKVDTSVPVGETAEWETMDADESGVSARQVDDDGQEIAQQRPEDLPLVVSPDDYPQDR